MVVKPVQQERAAISQGRMGWLEYFSQPERRDFPSRIFHEANHFGAMAVN
jgi:hypothetical protein